MILVGHVFTSFIKENDFRTEIPGCDSSFECRTLCSQSCLVVYWITSVSCLFVSVDAGQL